MVHGATLNLMWSTVHTGANGAHGMLVCMVCPGSRGQLRLKCTFTIGVRLSGKHPPTDFVIIHPNINGQDMCNGKNRVQSKLEKTAETPEQRIHATCSSWGQIGPSSWPQALNIMPHTWLIAWALLSLPIRSVAKQTENAGCIVTYGHCILTFGQYYMLFLVQKMGQ